MCGIAGWIDYDGCARDDQAAAARMARALEPRGPDAGGEWADEDGSFDMSISKDGTMVFSLSDAEEAAGMNVAMKYTLNKDEKTITIMADESGFQKLAEQSQRQYTEEEIRNALKSVVTTFDYSVDQERLTLTEREYGEQLVLVKE